MPLDERRIVREGYRLARLMLRDYRDPPSGLMGLVLLYAAVGRRLARDVQGLLTR